jgi:hypothetical protein
MMLSVMFRVRSADLFSGSRDSTTDITGRAASQVSALPKTEAVDLSRLLRSIRMTAARRPLPRAAVLAGSVVLLCICVPVLVIWALTRLPAEWLSLAKDFQTLLGAAVALGAAIIAFVNVSLQISSGQALERERRVLEQQQLASALIGELRAFAAIADGRSMVSYYRDNAEAVRASGSFAFWSLGLSAEYDRVFRGLGAAVGKLPADLPEKVVGVYALISGVFDRMKAAERGDYNGLRGDPAARMLEIIAEEANAAINAAKSVAGLLVEGRSAQKG